HRPGPSVSRRNVCPPLLWSVIFVAATGTPFSSKITPAQSAESAAWTPAEARMLSEANTTASRWVDSMQHRSDQHILRLKLQNIHQYISEVLKIGRAHV